jgi:hypothetical protein
MNMQSEPKKSNQINQENQTPIYLCIGAMIITGIMILFYLMKKATLNGDIDYLNNLLDFSYPDPDAINNFEDLISYIRLQNILTEHLYQVNDYNTMIIICLLVESIFGVLCYYLNYQQKTLPKDISPIQRIKEGLK